MPSGSLQNKNFFLSIFVTFKIKKCFWCNKHGDWCRLFSFSKRYNNAACSDSPCFSPKVQGLELFVFKSKVCTGTWTVFSVQLSLQKKFFFRKQQIKQQNSSVLIYMGIITNKILSFLKNVLEIGAKS